MTEIGQISLFAGLLISLYTAVAALFGAKKDVPELLESARYGVIVIAGLVTIASAALLYAIIGHDFQVAYVAQYSSRDMSLFYLVSSFWAGNDGSMLLWAWALAVYSAIVVVQNRRQNQELMPYVIAVLMANSIFFLALLTFVSSPFTRTPGVPADGQGLNPLLENMGMFFHPTTLYLGYVGFTVPFAFAMAALITGRVGDQWIRSTRRWTLFAWFFLGLGNLFGAQWAYVELGWGGYWAWDPVESASFMPWLTGTAYLHSVMIQQRRGMLKVWNIVLIILTMALVLFGTFLTRSGVLSSVHSFGQSSLGGFFVGFIGVLLIGSFGLLLDRLPLLKSENQLDSLMSRESSFLLNNLLLVGVAFATFWGTIFPLISEAVRGVKITVGPPFYNQVNGPIFLGLILLMGICPLIGWRKASTENLIRNFLYPAGVGIATGVALFLFGMPDFFEILSLSLVSFVTATILLEVARGTRARHQTSGQNYLRSLWALVWRNKPRYGGYIVHLGVLLLALGVAASAFSKVETEGVVKRGESIAIKDYVLTYEGLSSFPTESRDVVTAAVSVKNSAGRKIDSMAPAKTFHKTHKEPVTEVAIRTTLLEDLYVILMGWDGDVVTLKVLVNPMVVWLWVGGVVMLIGTAVAFWPDAREKRSLVAYLATAERRELALPGMVRHEA
ncbi:MAG: heme lyase CcmF/NrfE family subunit [Chloroflexi bacterium]|nr:heme lyase CcmF/NrfE family subunit [Chloroflexota bacterium]